MSLHGWGSPWQTRVNPQMYAGFGRTVMKALMFVVPLLAVLAGCSVTTTPAVVAAPAPTVIATVPALSDLDADGVADVYDRYPMDSRFR
jgi:hypothetical protein